MRILKISLAFVGLVVGAGFSTGQEVIQYFISFGALGIWSAVLSSVITILAGAVIIQTGSYFLAKDHKRVFSRVSHPVVSLIVDWSITVTLFGFGFVMFAGAGSTLEQEFGVPSWIGAGIMMVLVMVVGMLDVERVSNVISWITPTIVLAVIIAFVYTMFTIPGDFSVLDDIAQRANSPVEPWWLSAINYSCMSLMVGVSMCLVIGGNTPSSRVAGWGGFCGGVLFSVLLLMMAVVLLFNVEQVGDADVPMLRFFGSMHPVMVPIMVVIVYGMIFNTAIGMFYALGRRLTARRRTLYRPVFLTTCLLGYVVSFVGFADLIGWVYPVIGYIGIVMVAVLVIWWARHRGEITRESDRRDSIRELLATKRDPEREFTDGDEARLASLADESAAEPAAITDALELDLLRSQGKEDQR